jgi:hypothetical protein
MLKSLLPIPLKRRLRIWSDAWNREGAYFEDRERHDFINKALNTLDFNGIAGDYAEFGCCGCVTFGHAARAIRRGRHVARKLWAFDSFAGLPPAELPEDDHPRWIAGTMNTGVDEFRALCGRKGISNYDLIPGFYKDTLRTAAPAFFPPGSIAFAYVDCDVYSSTLDVLRFLLPRLKPGMIVAFDDYWCFGEGKLSGERRAFLEVFASARGWRFEPYQPFHWAGMAFVVEAI